MNIRRYPGFVCLLAVLAIPAFPQIDKQQKPAGAIEMTKADLFSIKGWDSMKIRILGVSLGMTREESRARIEALGFRLTGQDLSGKVCRSDECDVCNSKLLWTGIGIGYDHSDRVASISIDRIPEDADDAVRKTAIARRFIGKTWMFFNDYSSALRERLFGKESSIQADPGYPDVKRYKYDRLGMELLINGHRGPEKYYDLTVIFKNSTRAASE